MPNYCGGVIGFRELCWTHRDEILEALTARSDGWREGAEAAARLVERRMEQRFDEHGTTEPDTNASYYSGRAAEMFESLDEEAEACATAIRNLTPPETTP